MRRKRFLFSAGVALGVAALPAVSRAQFRGFAQRLVIGVNVPLSGDRAAGGREIANGVQAAVDEANDINGTATYAFATRLFDDANQVGQALVNAQFAAGDPTVLAVVGGFNPAVILGTLSTYANQQLPLLVPACTADALTARGYRAIWRLPTKDSVEGELHARFVAQRLKPKMAIAVTQDGAYGYDAAHGFVDAAKHAGMDADGFSFSLHQADYQEAAARIAGRKPEYVLLCGTTNAMGPLIPALRAAGYSGPFGATEGFYDEATLAAYASDFREGFISTSFPPLGRGMDARNELSDFRSRYTVTALSAFAYAAAQIIISAVHRTGATNRLSMLTTLQRPASYDTIVGSFQFTFTGDPVDPNLYFYRPGDKTFTYVAPAHPSAFAL